jgi:hypothetical protein
MEQPSGEKVEITPPKNYERNQMYIKEMNHFLEICKKDTEPICDYRDGKKALELAFGIQLSGRYKERLIFEE